MTFTVYMLYHRPGGQYPGDFIAEFGTFEAAAEFASGLASAGGPLTWSRERVTGYHKSSRGNYVIAARQVTRRY